MKYLTLAPEAGSLPLLVCCTPKLIELNSNHLVSGVPYKGEPIHIDVKNGEPYYADIILAEPCLSPVISSKLALAIQEGHFQYGEMIPVVSDFYKGFYVLNPMPLIDLVDDKNSGAIYVQGNKIYLNVCLKEYSGPEGIFRIKNHATFPFVTDSMADMIDQFDHKGITFGQKRTLGATDQRTE